LSLVALGVTGGIGAYKAVEVARGLQKRGHDVVALMTRSARRFVGPVTFEAITRRRVITDQWAPGMNADIEHIALTTEIDLLLVAPATANIIAKLAHGIADDFLTSFVLALRKPILLAPAMNTNMFCTRRCRRTSRRSPRAVCSSSIRAAAISPAGGSARAASPSPTRSPRPRIA
jgi:phosphopantothenoylcysteine decarboxylase / phosphopantothenate---cysteine ligase